MAPSPSAETRLLELAEASIRRGLAGLAHLAPAVGELDDALRAPGAAFVTVTVDGELNGCIGTLEAAEPLGLAVARLAYEAAFADPRLPRLRPAQWPRTAVRISVLGSMVTVDAVTEKALVGSLRPGVDGLLLEAAGRRATFLPAVWDTLPDPRAFVRQLLAKAGLAAVPWPAGMRAARYEVDEIGRDAAGSPAGRGRPGIQ